MIYICSVKHTEKHITKFLAFIAIFLVFGNIAAANIGYNYDVSEDNSAVFSFQEDNREKPFLFNEISIGEASQTISQNETFGFGLFGIFYSRQFYSEFDVSYNFHCSYSKKDKRKLIFQYLFPFHFFW